ncbi:MAG: NAD-dependent deacylase [Thermodesulfobacteriota bacterium]|nr:NAD-dependent deacylase [Thermodesulfobacteriota bacterium]
MKAEDLAEVSERLKGATHVVTLTGAGISQESGVPTFRGADGLWKNFRAEDLATPEAFERDPVTVWQWYDWRRSLIEPLAPNPGHDALADLEKATEAFTLVTQNVDGLHRAAGSRDPIEMHGTLWRVRCLQCHKGFDNRDVPIQILPKCKECGGLLRPDVVWFGEALDEDILHTIFRRVEKAQVMLVVGTSGKVQPAASLGLLAKKAGAFVVEVNRSKTPQSPFFDLCLEGKAGEILPPLVESLTE